MQMGLKQRSVTIVGAGIAGLALSIALIRRGWQVRVLEQAAAIREVGAGIQISPNGFAVLRALDLGGAMTDVGLPAAAVQLHEGNSGARLIRMDLSKGYNGRRYWFFHRADLIGLLERAARAQGVEILTGHQVARVALSNGAPVVHLTGGEAIECPGLIGADGLHSQVRAALNGAAQPVFAGQVAWRAVVAEHEAGEYVAQVFLGPGRHLVSYPLRDGAWRNIVAVEERRDWAAEGWSQRAEPAAIRAAFAGFGGPVPGWLDRLEDLHLWGLFRHPVAPVWHGQGAAILGDAAHPMLPFLAQGANMALEDAWVLAECLDGGRDLGQYQAARQARVARVIAAANGNARAFHLRGPTRVLAHLGLQMIGSTVPDLMLRRLDWLYAADVTKAA